MNPRIFREYDIRGVVGEDLTEEVVFTIGRAFGTMLLSEGGSVLSVGRDNRLHSSLLRDRLVEGLISTGCDVVDLGCVPTPLSYFSTHTLDVQGNVQDLVVITHDDIQSQLSCKRDLGMADGAAIHRDHQPDALLGQEPHAAFVQPVPVAFTVWNMQNRLAAKVAQESD